MISREKASNLFRLAVLMLINLCIVCLAFSHTSPLPSSQPAVDVLSQYGSRGEEVSKIQTRLKSWGYFSGEVTGYYGSQTTEAVKRFQQKHGLSATGVADQKTLELIGISSSSGASVSNADLELLARIISGVVYQPGAFTAITDGQINEAVTDSARRAARDALNGSDPTGGALYYYNPDKTSNRWIRSRPVITRIGQHLFCS